MSSRTRNRSRSSRSPRARKSSALRSAGPFHWSGAVASSTETKEVTCSGRFTRNCGSRLKLPAGIGMTVSSRSGREPFQRVPAVTSSFSASARHSFSARNAKESERVFSGRNRHRAACWCDRKSGRRMEGECEFQRDSGGVSAFDAALHFPSREEAEVRGNPEQFACRFRRRRLPLHLQNGRMSGGFQQGDSAETGSFSRLPQRSIRVASPRMPVKSSRACRFRSSVVEQGISQLPSAAWKRGVLSLCRTSFAPRK